MDATITGGRRTLRRALTAILTTVAMGAVLLVAAPGAVAPAAAVATTPSIITDVKVTAVTATTVTLSWTAPADGGSAITTYAIETSTDGTTWTPYLYGPSTATTVTVEDLTTGSGLSFRVAAVNVQGPGPFSVLDRASAVEAGGSRTCLLVVDGTVRCWGFNLYGGVGDGTNFDRSTPVKVEGISTAVQVAGSCALLADHTIRCWGANSTGGLGNGTLVNSSTPVTVSGIANATQISSSGSHACAVLSTGGIKCWGANGSGQLGNNTLTNASTPVTVSGISTATQVSVGGSSSCARLSSSAVKCWGANGTGQLGNNTQTDSKVPVSVSSISTATRVEVGDGHACALLSTATVKCWGVNDYGQLGNDSLTFSKVPVSVASITGVTQIDVASESSCALAAAGAVWCWGRNSYGQLGNGSTSDAKVPSRATSVPASTQISIGNQHACALLADGSSRCWGRNHYGQLGVGTTTVTAGAVMPLRIPIGAPLIPRDLHVTATSVTTASLAWTAPASGGSPITTYRVETSTDGTAWSTFGDVDITSAVVTDLEPLTDVWFRVAATSSLGTGSFAVTKARITGAPGTPGDLFVTSRSSSSVSLSWTAPTVTGVEPVSDYVVEYAVDGGAWTRFAHSPSTATSITVTGLPQGSSTRFRVAAVGLGNSEFISLDRTIGLSRSVYQTCMVSADRSTRCWGYSDSGSAGAGIEYDTSRPTPMVGLSDAALVASGWAHTCVALTDGRIACSGLNDRGQLGTPTPNRYAGYRGYVPASYLPVGGPTFTGVVDLAVGRLHSCVVLAAGTVHCWGANGSGQLGDGTTNDSMVPVTVTGITNAVAIEASESVSCAILADRTVRCWGSGGNGLLGNGLGTDASTPTPVVRLTDVKDLDIGREGACAVRLDGSVRCWGGNTTGALGNGTISSDVALTPTTVTGVTTAVDVAVADGFGVTLAGHACAVLADGGVKCWGANNNGQLGDGTLGSPRATAGPVVGIDDAVAIEAGYLTTTALLRDGSLVSWGLRTWGAIGDGLYRDAQGSSKQSTPVAVVDLRASVLVAGTPHAPMSAAVTSKTKTTVSLEWAAPDDDGGSAITDYEIRYSMDGQNWTTFAHAASTATTATVTGLTTGEAYEFQISAVNGEGVGDRASVSTVPAVLPSAPTGLAARSVTASSVTLEWVEPIDDGGRPIIDHLVETSTDGTLWTAFPHAPAVGSTITVDGLTPGQGYGFRVAVVTGEGASPATSQVLATPRSVPTAPGTVTVTQRTTTSVSLSWVPANANGASISDYTVEWQRDGDSGWFAVDHAASSATSLTATGLLKGVKHSFRVSAKNAVGSGGFSSTTAWTSIRPGAPTGLTVVETTPTAVTLRWVAPVDDGGRPITNFRIESLKAGAPAWVVINRAVSTATNATVTGLTKSASYSFRVAAITAEGAGATMGIGGVIAAGKPGAPTGLVQTAKTATSVSLRWTAPADNGGRAITNYAVQYQRVGASTWSTFNRAVSTATSATVTGLSRGVNYRFRVIAMNPVGAGAATGLLTVMPSSLVTSSKGTTPVPLLVH